jgi:hypothetical protein
VTHALQLKREHRRWYVVVITETEPVPLPAAGREVGVNGARKIYARAGLGSGQAAAAA